MGCYGSRTNYVFVISVERKKSSSKYFNLAIPSRLPKAVSGRISASNISANGALLIYSFAHTHRRTWGTADWLWTPSSQKQMPYDR